MKPSPGTVISLVALFVALSGTAVAIEGKIKRGQIAPKAVSAPKVAKGAIKAPKIRSDAIKPRHLSDAAAAPAGQTTLLAEEQLSGVDVFFEDESKLIGDPVEFDAPGPVVITFTALVKVNAGALDLWADVDGGDIWDIHLAEIAQSDSVAPQPYFWRFALDLPAGTHTVGIFGHAAANDATIHVDLTEQWSTVLSVWDAPTGTFVP